MSLQKAEIVSIGEMTHSHHDQHEERGDKDFVMSYSALKEFMRSPFSWRYGEKKEETPAMVWGSLVDELLLKCKGESRFVVAPETYGPDDKPWNWNAKECKAWRDQLPEGTKIIKQALINEAKIAVEWMKECKEVMALLSVSRYQEEWSAEWKDDDTGIVVPLAGVIDIVPADGSSFSDCLGDLKATSAINMPERAWSRNVFNSALNMQAALYLDAFNMATKSNRESFLHVIQCDEPPYEPAWREMDYEFIRMGRLQYKAALRDYAMCLSGNEWPRRDEMENQNRSPRGWVMTKPEPWMIMQAPAQYSNIEDI